MNNSRNQTKRRRNLFGGNQNLRTLLSGGLTVSQRMLLSTVMPALVIVTIFGILLTASTSIIADFSKIKDDILVEMEAIAQLEQSSMAIIAETFEYAFLGEDETLEEIEESLEELEISLDTYFSTDVSTNEEEATEEDLELRLRAVVDRLKADTTAIINLVESGTDRDELEAYVEDLETVETEMEVALGALRAALSRETEETTGALTNKVSRVRYALFVVSILGLVIFSFIARSLRISVINRLRDLTETVGHMGQGDLSRRAEVKANDEIGILATNFNSLVEWLNRTINSLRTEGRQIEILLGVNQELAGILVLDELLHRIVTVTQESFDYYHTHIYLLDEDKQAMVLVEGYGEAGAKMKARGHSISLQKPSLVTRAAQSGEIIRVDDVGQEDGWLPNPLLPDTRSEAAVPIISENVVIGVLDVQKNTVAGFTEADMVLLRALSSQIAIAIRNAREFDEVETALKKAQDLQLQYVEQGWDRNKIARRGVGRVQYSTITERAPSEDEIRQARQRALTQKTPGMITLETDEVSKNEEQGEETGILLRGETPEHALVAPITYSNVAIGNLQLHGIDGDKVWTDSEMAIINAVSDQVAQVAERLRLFEETQERASRERLIADISDKMRRAPNLEALMKVTTTELANALNPGRVFTKINVESQAKTQEEPQSADPEMPLPDESQPESPQPPEIVAENPSENIRAGSNGGPPRQENNNGFDSGEHNEGDVQ